MRWQLRAYIPLPGPLYLRGTQELGRHSRRHLRHAYAGTLPGWQCLHDHRSQAAAYRCARREEKRRAR
jgi:hypothetical protein